MNPDKLFSDDYVSNILKEYYKTIEPKNTPLSDEEVLERMNIETIEKFLRKKKLQNLNK